MLWNLRQVLIFVSRYEKPSAKYEAEYDALKSDIAALEVELDAQEQQAGSVDEFIAAVRHEFVLYAPCAKSQGIKQLMAGGGLFFGREIWIFSPES